MDGGDAETIGTRLIFAGCWVRNTRAFCGRLLGRAAQAGLSALGVDVGKDPPSPALKVGDHSVYIVLVNAQPLDGLIVSGVDAYCRKIAQKSENFVLVCVAGRRQRLCLLPHPLTQRRGRSFADASEGFGGGCLGHR